MRILVQRSGKASVSVDNNIVGSINNGLVLLVGFTDNDNLDTIKYLVKKVLNLRIFPDESNTMNKNILDFGGSILSISQFTLYADTSRGNRPSYINAMKNEEAKKMFDLFNEELSKYIEVQQGVFGADMIVNITNIGPTTILLEK